MRIIMLILLSLVMGCQSSEIEPNPEALIVLHAFPRVAVHPQHSGTNNWVEFGFEFLQKGKNTFKATNIKLVDSSETGSTELIAKSKKAFEKWMFSGEDVNHYAKRNKRFLVRIKAVDQSAPRHDFCINEGVCAKKWNTLTSFNRFIMLDELIDTCITPSDTEYQNFSGNYMYVTSLIYEFALREKPNFSNEQIEEGVNKTKKKIARYVSKLIAMGGCDGPKVKKLIGSLNFEDKFTAIKGKHIIDASLLLRSEPNYPKKAKKNRIKGWVQLSFDVNENGKAVNIELIKTIPNDTFVEAAINALLTWQYSPRLVNGVPTTQTKLSTKIDFKVDDSI